MLRTILQEAMNNFFTALEAVKLLAAGGVGAAIIGLIGKLWVDRKLAQERTASEKELESLKAELAQKHTIHKLQFEKEFTIYQELWEVLVKLRDACGALAISGEFLSPGETTEQRQAQKVKKFSEAYNDVDMIVRFQSPFYARKVYENSSKLAQMAREQAIQAFLAQPNSERHKQLQERFGQMSIIIDDIEVSIRERIGLISSAELVE